MNDEKFFEICFGQYRYEQQQADAIYQRAGILLTALPIIGAIAYKLGRPDLIPIWFSRVDIFLYLTAVTAAFGAVGTGTVFTILCICPRKRYGTLTLMQSWENWRNEYREKLDDKGNPPSEKEIGEGCLQRMKERILEAEKSHAALNERRRQYFKYTIFSIGAATAAIAFEAFFHMLLYLQGI
ncbi:MAG: hypothetical protein QGG42_14720 [Phycisphaerae bacterium]|jgi:hypothetical protein|nr:hypothetical protein [Phycisphaerae bacterium]